MARMRVDTVYRHLVNYASGELTYINTIGLTVNAIQYVRKCVNAGALVPCRDEVEKIYKDVEGVMEGDVILPQVCYEVYPEKLPDPTN